MNILEALSYGINELSSFSNPRLDASILLQHATNFTDLDLLINQDKQLSTEQEDLFKAYISRRKTSEPVSYITGVKEFYGLNFNVNEHTLIPRPDTELLVDHVLEYIKQNNISNPKILDLGTGSGAIIISILANVKGAQGFAVDINPNAILKASENAKLNNVDDRLTFIESSWFSNVKENDFDIIVANPPYITTKMMDELDTDVKDFEPNLALEGGVLGFEPYVEIVENSPTFLTNKARIFLEIGFDQQDSVLNLFNKDFWYNKKCFKDLGNNDRLIVVDFLKNKQRIKPMNFKKYALLTACISVLTGCFGANNMQDLESYKKDFKDENVNVFLKSFSDHRQGQALILPEGPSVLYAYKPQSLTNGQMLPLLGYYLYHTADLENTLAEKSIGIDVSIRDVKTMIRSGNLGSGKFGYYSAEVQARVILRDMRNNEIIDTFPLVISKNKARTTTTGRTPSPQADKYAVLQLVDEVSIELADDILEQVQDVYADYYKKLAKKAKQATVFEYSTEEVITPKVNPLDKIKDVQVNEVEEETLKVTPDLLDKIEMEEQALYERKEEQRRLFEQKLKDQKYLDFIDSKQ